MKKFYLTIFAIAVLVGLTGCFGGNSGGSSKNDPKFNLPNDPGAAGKATLEGIDSNGNGVRDDIEIKIHEYAPKPDQEELRSALMQYAKGLQGVLAAGASENQEKAMQAYLESSRAIACQMMKSDSETEASDLLRWTANTKERSDAYQKYSKMLNGKLLSGDKSKIPCDYDQDREAKMQAEYAKSIKKMNVNLPPDPGEEGKQTLAGIDSNNNGVRDDVEIAIYNYAPRDDQERYRAALTQQAKAWEARMLEGKTDDLEKIKSLEYEVERSIKCLKISSPNEIVVEEIRFIGNNVVNTRKRDRNALDFEDSASKAEIYSATLDKKDRLNPCDYDRENRQCEGFFCFWSH
ncbi:MAG: hypothetical protein LBU73_08715 [Helicobacteraceae bacterium]|jgi:hypothetical protein|nr:hypothetical protein [Helicobacteraceae bacterium]